MAILKYKNGSKWEELQMGGSGLDQYPIGSFYTSPESLIAYYAYSADTTSNINTYAYTYDVSTAASPAILFGGIWIELSQTFRIYQGGTSNKSFVGYRNPNSNITAVFENPLSSLTYTAPVNAIDAFYFGETDNGRIGEWSGTNSQISYNSSTSSWVPRGIYQDMYFDKIISPSYSQNNMNMFYKTNCFRMWQRIA